MPDSSWRNIWIYCATTLLLAICGAYVLHLGHEWGGLVFVLGPSVAAIMLRVVFCDGWADAGLAPRLRENRGIYGLLLLLFPVGYALTLGAGAVMGHVHLMPGFIFAFPHAVGGALAPSLFYALAEEMGWRGYLEPRLAALGVRPVLRHGFVAIVWGIWHIPFLVSEGQTFGLSPLALVTCFAAGTLLLSLLFGQAVSSARSIWPVVICHGLANALALPLQSSELAVIAQPAHFGARPDSTVMLVLLFIAWRVLIKIAPG